MKPPKVIKSKLNKLAKNSYLADDNNYQSFSNQLEKLGLELRDITGDGNCCFRALSDQLEGNESQHLDYRKRVCQYMRQNRNEFEPFVAALIDDEDDNEKKLNLNSNKKLDAFEKYIKNLEQPGTYADNGCLVAFARLYQVNINIHQLNLPIWTINGFNDGINKTNKKKEPIRELHLSYHNGEHYSSIRPLGDKSKTPTNIYYYLEDQSTANKSNKQKLDKKITKQNYMNDCNNFSDNCLTDSFERLNLNEIDLNDKIEQIIDITKFNDIEIIKLKLIENNFDIQSTIDNIITNQIIDNNNVSSLEYSGKLGKVKFDKKYEKKQRQMERARLKVLEQREKELLDANNSKCNQNESTQQISQNIVSNSTTNNNNNNNLNINLSNIQTKSI